MSQNIRAREIFNQCQKPLIGYKQTDKSSYRCWSDLEVYKNTDAWENILQWLISRKPQRKGQIIHCNAIQTFTDCPVPCSQAAEQEMDGRPGGRHHQTGKQPICHSESAEINLTIAGFFVCFSIYFPLNVELHIINLYHDCGLSPNNVGTESLTTTHND